MARTPEDWLLQADYDLETAEAMFKSERYIYVVFFCHLAIEKGLKGIYQKRVNETPPKIHNLVYFTEKLDLSAPQDTKEFIAALSDESIPTRYPTDFKKIYKEFTAVRAQVSIEKSKGVLEWIKKEFARSSNI
jgi:HEPN domain-containing protein